MRVFTVTVFWLLTAAALFGQTFEVSRIKVNTSGNSGSSSHGTRGQLEMENVPLKMLIQRAFVIQDFQLSAPDWTADARFDIVAKYPEGTKDAERAPMLRNLLAQQFKLTTHPGSKELAGYGLVAAKSGFKLKPVEPGQPSTNTNGSNKTTKVVATKMSMTNLASLLSRELRQPVADKTGFKDVYDLEFEFTLEDQPAGKEITADSPPYLFDVLQQKFGLSLQRQKVTIDTIVVDHVERVPIDN